MSNKNKVPIDDQIAALQRSIVNLRGHLATLEDLIAKKKMDPIVLKSKSSWLPELEAAERTLQWVKNNQQKIRNLIR